MNREPTILEYLTQYLVVLWKEWPVDLEAVTLPPPYGGFSLRGTCPHCRETCAFITVGPPSKLAAYHDPTTASLWAIMQCQGCLKFILGAAHNPNNSGWVYRVHYPLGQPDDSVAEAVPPNIAADFKEALRCRWVDAFNATVEMCRRAVQAACIDLKAPSGKRLVDQIDWLAGNGTITVPLKEMAHRVRLGGNLGAHPPEDPNDATTIIIGPEYADAVLEFTRELFQHVYVMPERLKKFTF